MDVPSAAYLRWGPATPSRRTSALWKIHQFYNLACHSEHALSGAKGKNPLVFMAMSRICEQILRLFRSLRKG